MFSVVRKCGPPFDMVCRDLLDFGAGQAMRECVVAFLRPIVTSSRGPGKRMVLESDAAT